MSLDPGRYKVSNVLTKRWIGVADFHAGAEEPTVADRHPNRTELLRTVEDSRFTIQVLHDTDDPDNLYSFAFGGIPGDGLQPEEQLRVSYHATIGNTQYTIWYKDPKSETSSWWVEKVEENVYRLQVHNEERFAFNDAPITIASGTGNTHYSIQLAPLKADDPAFLWKFEKVPV